MVKILVLENDFEMQKLMIEQLKAKFHAPLYEIMGADSGKVALQKLKENAISLLILNEKLPEMSGLEVMKAAGSQSCRYLLITNRAESEELVEIFEAGAHDYLLKPFDRSLFISRVRSMLRAMHPESNPDSSQIHLGPLTIHPNSDDVFCGSDRVHLTPSEFKLLHALALHRGQVLTRDKLIELVQGQGIVVIDRAVDTHIFGLRKKLNSCTKDCSETIQTVRGVGYRVE